MRITKVTHGGFLIEFQSNIYAHAVAFDETQAYMATSSAGRWLSSAMGFRHRPPPEYAKVFRRKWKDRLA